MEFKQLCGNFAYDFVQAILAMGNEVEVLAPEYV